MGKWSWLWVVIVVMMLIIMMVILLLIIMVGDLRMQQTYLRGVRGCTSDRAVGR